MAKIKRLVLAFLVFTVIISCNNEVIIIYDISASKFIQNIEKHEKALEPYLILDVRPEQEYLAGHVDGALNYPAEDLPIRFTEIIDLAEHSTYIYGNDMEQSFKAAKFLAEQSFKKIYNCEGTVEAEYDFVLYSPVRLVQGFELAKKNSYKLVDYRIPTSRRQYKVSDVNFVPYPNLKSLINSIDYAKGYVVFSTTDIQARDCAAELISYGFDNVYYCIDNILDYPDYFEYHERKLDIESQGKETEDKSATEAEETKNSAETESAETQKENEDTSE